MKAILILFHCLRLLMEGASRVIFGIIYWNSTKSTLPPISNLLLIEPAIALASKVRLKKITSEELVVAFISRIKEVNPLLNAMVDSRFDEAIEEAKQVDKFIKSECFDSSAIAKTKPYLGVPFTVKDSMQVTGLRQTAGLYARKDFVSDGDSDGVHLLKEAGAIILGVTNVSELCMWWESANTIYGRTNNPYDLRRIVGGSSGGEGCILSACGSPMGIGSDIGGSIRMPAYFNGIFGHKPSAGIVSNLGQVPATKGELNFFLATGPMSRFASDLSPMLRVLASSNVHLLSLDNKVNLKQIKVYYMEDDCGNCVTTPVEKELKAALLKVVDHFKTAHKVPCTKLKLTEFRRSGDIFFGKLGGVKDARSFSSELVLNKGEINAWFEMLKWIFRVSYHTLPGLCLSILENATKGRQETQANVKAMDTAEALSRKFKDMLSDDAVFLFPPHPTEAPYHGQTLFRPFNFLYTAIFNMMGFPVTECPLGLNSSGLPLGVQVVGNMNQDHLCLAVAEEIERAFGGWVCPSVVL